MSIFLSQPHCVCQSSLGVGICVKICGDQLITIWMRTKSNFHWISFMMCPWASYMMKVLLFTVPRVIQQVWKGLGWQQLISNTQDHITLYTSWQVYLPYIMHELIISLFNYALYSFFISATTCDCPESYTDTSFSDFISTMHTSVNPFLISHIECHFKPC